MKDILHVDTQHIIIHYGMIIASLEHPADFDHKSES